MRESAHRGPDMPFEYGEGRDPTVVHLCLYMAPQKKIWGGQVWGSGWPLDRTPFRERFAGKCLLQTCEGGSCGVRPGLILLKPHAAWGNMVVL